MANEILAFEEEYGDVFGKYDRFYVGEDASKSALGKLSDEALLEWSEKLKTYNAKSKEFEKRRDRLLNDIFNRHEGITHKSDPGLGLLCTIDIGAIHDDIFKAEQELREKTVWFNSKEGVLALQKAEDERREKLITSMNEHYTMLKKNFAKSIKFNDYGAVEQDERIAEFTKFLESVGFSFEKCGISFEKHGITIISASDHDVNNGKPDDLLKSAYLSKNRIFEEYQRLLARIDEEKIKDAIKGFDPTNAPKDGFEFEGWVASQLEIFGWKSSATMASGDQGIDVIAEKNSITVGIQCKRYSGVVGNKAVQEVAAGRQHFGLDFGAVITTSRFTRSAEELALTNDIFLLKVEQIPDLENIISHISNRV